MVQDDIESIIDIPDEEVRELVKRAFDELGKRFSPEDYQRCRKELQSVGYKVFSDSTSPACIDNGHIWLNKCTIWAYKPQMMAHILAEELQHGLTGPNADSYLEKMHFSAAEKEAERDRVDRLRLPEDLAKKVASSLRRLTFVAGIKVKCSGCKYQYTCEESDSLVR